MPSPEFSRRSFLALALSVSTVALVGCPGPGNSGGAGGETGKTPGVLRYPLAAEPTTLDPALASDGPTIDLLQNIHEGLVGWDDKSEVVPKLAEKMPEVSADGKVYTFTLRDAKFHNGRKIVAEDFVYSITRALDAKLNSPVSRNYLDDIVGAIEFADGKATGVAGLKAIDDKTLQITIKAPRAYFLGKMTYPTAFAVAKEAVEAGPKTQGGAGTIDATNSVGAGPFSLKSYVRGNKVILNAFAEYHEGKPKLTSIERPIVLDTATARNLYDAGQLDYVTLEKGDYEKDQSNPELKDQIKIWSRAATYYVGINQTNYAPFKNAKVRQAFAAAIDKDAIIKNVLLGINTKAEGVLPEGLPGFQKDFKGFPHDPEKAKKLLAEAGFANGAGLPPVTLCFREKQPDLYKAAEVIKEQLAGVGIKIELREMEWGTFLKATDDKQIDLFHMRWSADYLDPQNFLSLLLASTSPENRTGYNNPAYDALCARADAELDPAKRMDLYHQAERMVIDDAPWVPLYYQKDLELVKPWVKGLRDSLMGHLPHATVEIS